MRRVLVTGGAGFIGAWIAGALADRGWSVRVFDMTADRRIGRDLLGPRMDAFEWVVGDIAAAGTLEAASRDCSLIVHLAAVLTPFCAAEPVRGAEINVLGTLRAFEAARANGIGRVLVMSSAGVFGPAHADHPEPATLYGAWKLAGEGIGRAYAAMHGIDSVSFRPLVVYGPGRETGLSAGPTLACRAASRGEPCVIGFSGICDLVYVADVAAAFAAAAEGSAPGASVFNLPGAVVEVAEVAREIMRQAPGAEITVDGPPLPIMGVIPDNGVHAMFPGLTRTGLADGIAATLAHYRARA
ncbi:NAD(P)-dependent oxidoreductase [Elioraea sp.]|uniref:NAD-dependent epimerase/dehydratase family protein n=1 Tax=Elioraea sp. TaxID=2185103 RepID=UPI0025BA84F5|nr:NAD(P)-dependent oxidoreductase [Elioraea sp.]